MKYSKYTIASLLFFGMLASFNSSAQVRSNLNVFNGGASNSTAFLDASSSAAWNNTTNNGKGLIFPRVDLTQFTSLVMSGASLPSNFPSLMDGTLVYNVGTGNALVGGTPVEPGYYYYRNISNTLQGGTWMPIVEGSNGLPNTSDWLVKGNVGTTKTMFIGTQDLQPLTFKVNGIKAGQFMVNGSLPSSLNLSTDLFIRDQRMLSFGGDPIRGNILVGAIGADSLIGTRNTLLAAGAGRNIKTGNANTFIGTLAGSEIKDGSANTFIGDNAGTYSQNASSTTSIGRYAGPVGNLRYATTIGNGALVKQDNALILGGIGVNRVAIGINTEIPRATLDVATDDAVVLPVGDTKVQPVIGIPGMLRFNMERDFAEYFNNYNAWVNLSNNTGWTLKGNYGAVPAHNYVGTSDNQPMSFAANGTEAFRINPNGNLLGNVNIKAPLWINGQRMLWLEDAGKGPNIMAGYWNAFSQTYSITGANNILFGPSSGSKVTTGNNNIFLGRTAGALTVTGNDNIGIGVQAGPDLPEISNSMVFHSNNRPRKSNALLFGDDISGFGFSAVGINTAKPAAIFDVNSTDAMIVPSGTTGERPASAEIGMLRFNQTTKLLEYFDGAKWVGLNPPRVIKTTYTAQNYTIAVNTYKAYDIPVTGAKLGGVVSALVEDGGWLIGQNKYCLITEKRVIADGMVRVVFWLSTITANTDPGDIYVDGTINGFIPTFKMRITVIQ